MSARLEKAKRLMESTDLGMYEISDRVEIYNVEHLTGCLKSVWDQPGDYKRGRT